MNSLINISQDKKKIDYIDAVKGIGILLVILGHTNIFGFPEVLGKIVYSFHMPLFFVLSGFLYNKNKYDKVCFKNFLQQNANRYMVPYLIFALVNLVIVLLFDFYKTGFDFSVVIDDLSIYIPGILYCYADVRHMPNCSPIWFLCCLFLARIVFYLLHKYIKKYSDIIALSVSIISFVLSAAVTVILPLKIATVPVAISFMEVGYLMRKYSMVEKSRLWHVFLAVPGVVAAVINYEKVGLNENVYGNPLLFICSSVLISYSVIVFCSKAEFLSNKFILFMGSCSITVIGYNYFLRTLTAEIYYLIPYIKNIPINWISSFVLTVIFAFVLCILSNKGIMKIPLKGKIID